MSFLIDTNVVSELRKGERADSGVRQWFASAESDELFLSVLVIGEIRKGIENIRRRDPASATSLDAWLHKIEQGYAARILPVSITVAEAWGRFNSPAPLPVIDSLMAATAHVHGLTVVTRNVADIGRSGVPVLNPFAKA